MTAPRDTFRDDAHGGTDGAFLAARDAAAALWAAREIGPSWRVERMADGWRIVRTPTS